MEYIHTANAPEPAGHYSQAVVHNGLVYVAGQVPINPKTREILDGPVEDQTRLVLLNLKAVLEAAGSNMNHVLKCTVYVADISLWGAVNVIYGEAFGEHLPARAIVPTKPLHHGILVEIDAIASVIA